MRARAALLVIGGVIVAFAACSDDSSELTATTEASLPESTTATEQVPDAQELATMLLSEADLDGGWSVNPWGLPPTDRSSINFGEGKFSELVCDDAPEDFRAAEQGLHWQAFVHLDNPAGGIFIEELLWADERAAAEALYATLTEGLDACMGSTDTDARGSVTREPMAVPEVGDERTGLLISGEKSGGENWIMYAALVRDGPVLMYTQTTVAVHGEVEPEFGDEEVEQVIRTMADKIVEEPVSDPLEGVWLTSDVFMTFGGGEYEVTMDPAHFDDVTDSPFEIGTYEVDGTTLTLTPGPPTADMVQTDLACVVGQVGVYKMTVSADGSEIRLKVVSDDCTVRRDDFRYFSLKKAQTAATESSPSQPVFDLAADSICTWFTADDMNEIVAAAQQRAGTEYGFSPFTSGDCEAESGWSYEHSGGLSVWFTLEPVESFFARAAEEPDTQVNDVNPAEFVGHGFLDDEVSYQMNTYQFAWAEDVDGYLRVDGHQDETLYFKFTVDGHDRPIGEDTMTKLGLAMVNEVLDRMNWINSDQ